VVEEVERKRRGGREKVREERAEVEGGGRREEEGRVETGVENGQAAGGATGRRRDGRDLRVGALCGCVGVGASCVWAWAYCT
jgi:hypothetical protein